MTASSIDPAFPQMAYIFDTSVMQKVLQNALFKQSQFAIARCTLGERRYRPGKSLLLSYQLDIDDRITNTRHAQWLTAQVCPVEQASGEFTQVCAQATQTELGIPAVSYVPEMALWLWAFPHDRHLPHLPKLLELTWLHGYFAKNFSAIFLAPERIISIQTKIMHYLPENSCMIRYTLIITDSSQSNVKREFICYAKHYADDSGAKTYANMQQLAAQLPTVAIPLLYDADLHTFWQTHVNGEPAVWNSINQSSQGIANIAEAIAALHSCLLLSDKRYGYSIIQNELAATGKIAKATNAELYRRISVLVEALQQQHAQMEWGNSRMAPLHLDLKLGNLLIDGANVAIIDLDCVALGDPLADTGSFIANLYLNGLLAGADISEIEPGVVIFYTKYCAAMPWTVERTQLDWYVAAALLHEVVRRSLRQQNPQRLKHLNTFIELSASYLARCQQPISGLAHD